jgi:hypothetical protein
VSPLLLEELGAGEPVAAAAALASDVELVEEDLLVADVVADVVFEDVVAVTANSGQNWSRF